MQFADDRHATDEVLERYSMGCLTEPALAEFEEHLLVCAACQDRLAREDDIRQRIRDSASVLQQPRAVARRLPKFAWGLGLAAAVLLVVAGGAWQSARRSAAPPIVILLRTMRGTDDATPAAAVAGKPLTLALDLTDLPQFSEYTVEIVDAGGRPAFQSRVASGDNGLQATLAGGLAAGAYFVRVYSPARDLLREYALTVRPLFPISNGGRAILPAAGFSAGSGRLKGGCGQDWPPSNRTESPPVNS